MIGPGFKSHQWLLTDMEECSLAAMLATKRLAGVAPELNLREHVTHMPLPSANKVAHSGFET